MNKTKKIIIVSDLEEYLFSASSILESAFFDLFYCKSINESAEIVNNIIPDFIIVFIDLAYGESEKFYNKINSENKLKKTKIILYTDIKSFINKHEDKTEAYFNFFDINKDIIEKIKLFIKISAKEIDLLKKENDIDFIIQRKTNQLEKSNKELQNEIDLIKKNEEKLKEIISINNKNFKIASVSSFYYFPQENILFFDCEYFDIIHNVNISKTIKLDLIDYIDKYIFESDKKLFEKEIKSLVKKGENISTNSYKYRTIKGNGKNGYIILKARYPNTNYGKTEKIIITVQEISEYVKSENELKQYREQLESLITNRTKELIDKNRQLNNEIAERKQAVTALNETEEIFNMFMEHSPIYVFFKDENIRPIKLSKNYENMIGMPLKDLLGKTMDELFPSDLSKSMIQDDIKVLNEGIPIEVEEELAGKYYFTLKFPIIKDNKPKLLAGYTIDITERKLAEIALKEKTEELDSFFNLSIDMLCISDIEGYFKRVNLSWEKILGFKISDLEGKKLIDFVHPDDCKKTKKIFADLALGKKVLNFVNKIRCFDGSYKSIEWRSIPYENKLIFTVARDITESLRIHEEIRQLNAELERRVKERTIQLEASNKELESFSYSVSHDLRAPLRAIYGFSKILTEKFSQNLNNEGKEYLNIIINNTNNMNKLIDDLLTFSKISKQGIHITKVNIEEIIKDTFNQIKLIYKDRNIELIIKPLPLANCDLSMIKIVITNFVSNAVKYSSKKEKSIIEFGGYNTDYEAVYYIKDNGVGFNMKYADKLFVVFQRLHSQEEFEGTGVGLALVQRIIHRHKGRVWGEGKLDEGSVFYFSLPNK